MLSNNNRIKYRQHILTLVEAKYYPLSYRGGERKAKKGKGKGRRDNR